MNDADTQAKRISIWQELLAEMPSEDRRSIERKPSGDLFQNYCALVELRLAEWSQHRENHAKKDSEDPIECLLDRLWDLGASDCVDLMPDILFHSLRAEKSMLIVVRKAGNCYVFSGPHCKKPLRKVFR